MPGFANPTMTGNSRTAMRRNASRWCAQPVGRGGRGRRSIAAGRPGRGYFSGYRSTLQSADPEWEKEALGNRSRALQSELDAINKQLEEMDAQEKAP
jgi:hypothetical protein